MRYYSFAENQTIIESTWDDTFGDRKNEIVFIGQDMDKAQIRADLNACLATEKELATNQWRQEYDDEWPTEQVIP